MSHLVNGDLGVLSRDRDRYLGTPPPDGADESVFVRWLDELMQEWVSATRGLSPRMATGLLRWSGPQVVEHFAETEPNGPNVGRNACFVVESRSDWGSTASRPSVQSHRWLLFVHLPSPLIGTVMPATTRYDPMSRFAGTEDQVESALQWIGRTRPVVATP